MILDILIVMGPLPASWLELDLFTCWINQDSSSAIRRAMLPLLVSVGSDRTVFVTSVHGAGFSTLALCVFAARRSVYLESKV